MVTPDVGELLVIQRALHVKEIHLEPSQREQIFHTQCTIEGNVCELTIDRVIYTNMASMTLIDKLQLPTKAHWTSYTLQRLKQRSEVTILKQALILFLVGLYYGEVLCDVLPMDTCHVLLGRP